MVLDQGNLVEFDTVPNLLARPGGVFAGMAAAAGLGAVTAAGGSSTA